VETILENRGGSIAVSAIVFGTRMNPVQLGVPRVIDCGERGEVSLQGQKLGARECAPGDLVTGFTYIYALRASMQAGRLT
jgi:hypothetical protein